MPTVSTLLSDHTTLRLGGPADDLTTVTSEQELIDTIGRVDEASRPLLVLGGGSNLVIADAGFPGTVVRVDTRGVAASGDGDGHVLLTAQAGEPWDNLVASCVAQGWAGLECLSGIPGLVGATPIQNVGAYGQEVAQTITSVRVYDRRRRATAELDASECAFAYRTSALKGTSQWVVLSVTFRLRRSAAAEPLRYAELAGALGAQPGDTPPLADVRQAVLALRRGKGMVLDPADPDSVSAGSFFTNPILRRDAVPSGAPAWPAVDGSVKTSAAWLIQHAGFSRGHGNGRVAISSKHTLALVNRGGATTAELLELAREIRDGVKAAFGVELIPEPTLVGVTL